MSASRDQPPTPGRRQAGRSRVRTMPASGRVRGGGSLTVMPYFFSFFLFSLFFIFSVTFDIKNTPRGLLGVVGGAHPHGFPLFLLFLIFPIFSYFPYFLLIQRKVMRSLLRARKLACGSIQLSSLPVTNLSHIKVKCFFFNCVTPR